MTDPLIMLNNLVVWAIILCSLPCYCLLLEMLLTRDKDNVWLEYTSSWLDTLRAGISALPLLGLLGTITGLLKTFSTMASGAGNHQTLMSGGIADALFTTEMGLVMAIPGWLMLAWLDEQRQGWELRSVSEL